MTKDLTKREDERNRKTVWRAIGHKSVRQIAEDTGLTVNEVVALRNEMFDGVDALTVDQRRLKTILDLDEIATRARELVETVSDDRAKAPLLSAATSAMKTALQAVSALETQDNSKVDALNQLRQKELLSLMQTTVDASVKELAEQFDVDPQQMFDVFNRNLLEAALDMENRNEQ